jgi:hypothetical protein
MNIFTILSVKLYEQGVCLYLLRRSLILQYFIIQKSCIFVLRQGFAMKPRLACNWWSSCLGFLRAGITSMSYHAQLTYLLTNLCLQIKEYINVFCATVSGICTLMPSSGKGSLSGVQSPWCCPCCSSLGVEEDTMQVTSLGKSYDVLQEAPLTGLQLSLLLWELENLYAGIYSEVASIHNNEPPILGLYFLTIPWVGSTPNQRTKAWLLVCFLHHYHNSVLLGASLPCWVLAPPPLKYSYLLL